MKTLESRFCPGHAKCGRASPVEINRILERLERHRCESCGQICLVPHIRIFAQSPGSRPLCKPQVPLPTGFSLPAV